MSGDFFSGLIAALRLYNVEFIETRDNIHHAQFRDVAHVLEELADSGVAGTEDLPGLFRPTVATGLYGEWDDALLRMQQGFGSSPNPSYLGLKLVLSEGEAHDVLLDFTPETRSVLQHLARTYVEAAPAARANSAEYA